MKFLLLAVLTVLTGCVCVPCEGAELFATPPARIVETRGPWVLVQRGGESCWMYDHCYATSKLHSTGKAVLKDTVKLVEATGDIVIGAGTVVVGVGHEILQRTHSVVKCLVCPKPTPAKPPARVKPKPRSSPAQRYRREYISVN